MTPARGSPGLVHLQLQSHAALFGAATFSYLEQPTLTGVHPALGPVAGGTTVIIAGRHFDQTSSLLCVFGAHAAPARIFSATRLECYAPPGDGAVTLSVSFDGAQVANSSLTFTYLPALRVVLLAPARGVTKGSSLLTVTLGGWT